MPQQEYRGVNLMIQATGMNQLKTYSDMCQIFGPEQVQKLEQDKQQFLNNFVYWSGVIKTIINENCIGIRMNPAMSLKREYDIILYLPQGVNSSVFQNMINKQFNFAGQITSLDTYISIQMFNYQIYNNQNVSQEVLNALQQIQQIDIQQLRQQAQTSLDYMTLLQKANPNKIGAALKQFEAAPCVITCIVKKIVQQPQKVIYVQTKPQGLSILGTYDYDVAIILGPMTIIPPTLKAGALATFRGNYAGFENNMVTFFTKQIQVHMNQTIDRLPLTRGQLTVQQSADCTQQINYQAEVKKYLLEQLNNPAQSAPSSIKPPTIRAPSQGSMNANQDVQSQRTQQSQSTIQSVQTKQTQQTQQTQQATASQANNQEQQVEDNNGYKPETIIDADGHVQIQEETNELQGQDCSEVARRFMAQAPQAAYIQPVKTILDYEKEDEALQIARKLNENGKMKTIGDDLMNNLDALNAFNLDNQQVEDKQQNNQNEYGDYTQYADVLNQNGYGYDQGGYSNNYGGYDIGGSSNYGSNNYGSYGNDYGSSYNTGTTDYNNYSNYGNYGNYNSGW